MNCHTAGHKWEECTSITGHPLVPALQQFARLKADQNNSKGNRDKGDGKNAKGKNKNDGKNGNGKGKGNKGNKGGKPWRAGGGRGNRGY